MVSCLGRRSRLWISVALPVVALVIFCAPASASPGAYRILIVHSDDNGPPATLRAQLAAFPGVATVDVFDAHAATPTAAQLDSYDMVISQSGDHEDLSPAGVGNALADYYDQGGVVVQFAWDNDHNGGYAPTGRWATGGYEPFVPGPTNNVSATLGTHNASSPLMQGVNALQAGDRTNPTLASGATLLANWSDDTPLIAVKGRAVSVSAFVGDESGQTWSGDFARLAINAMHLLGRQVLTVAKTGVGAGTVTSTPAGINCGTTCNADYVLDTPVTLTVSGTTGTFEGWSGGGCSGTSTCTVTMNSAQGVTAKFAACVVPSLTHKKLKRAAVSCSRRLTASSARRKGTSARRRGSRSRASSPEPSCRSARR